MPKFYWFLIGLLFVAACKSTYPTSDITYQPPNPLDGHLERGKALTNMICAPCHLDTKTEKLSGKRLEDIPGSAGKIYAPNITKDSEAGIGKYSDAELAWLMRTGIMRDGRFSNFMVFPGLADTDLDAIIRFLRSDDPAVEPVAESTPPTKLSLPAKIIFNAAFKPFDYPAEPVPLPDRNNPELYGKYMVQILGCFDCHSAGFAGLDKLDPEQSKGYMGGGTALRGSDGKKIVGSNLTPDEETGIGSWTQGQFEMAIYMGMNKDGDVIRFPMPDYSDLKGDEIKAIYTYLRTIPPIKNKVERKENADF